MDAVEVEVAGAAASTSDAGDEGGVFGGKFEAVENAGDFAKHEAEAAAGAPDMREFGLFEEFEVRHSVFSVPALPGGTSQ